MRLRSFSTFIAGVIAARAAFRSSGVIFTFAATDANAAPSRVNESGATANAEAGNLTVPLRSGEV